MGTDGYLHREHGFSILPDDQISGLSSVFDGLRGSTAVAGFSPLRTALQVRTCLSQRVSNCIHNNGQSASFKSLSCGLPGTQYASIFGVSSSTSRVRWDSTTPMTCWIGLDDANTGNGWPYYVPGSHNWGLLDKKPIAGDMDAVRGSLTPEQVLQFDHKIPVEVKRGEASFHHPLLMHGSYENHSERRRRATLINVFADGVVSNREDGGSHAFPVRKAIRPYPPAKPWEAPTTPCFSNPTGSYGN